MSATRTELDKEMHDGFHDGVSFAYTFGIDEINKEELAKHCFGKSDLYVIGFSRGFEFVEQQIKDIPHV